MNADLRREIRWEPRPGAMNVRFLLHGENGAVQFVWRVRTDGDWGTNNLWKVAEIPQGWDVGFHAVTPREWQTERDRDECDVLACGSCFYDGSSLQGEALGKRFAAEGVDAVWAELEERYSDWLAEP